MCTINQQYNHQYGYNINNQYNHKDIHDNKLLKLLYYYSMSYTTDRTCVCVLKNRMQQSYAHWVGSPPKDCGESSYVPACWPESFPLPLCHCAKQGSKPGVI